MSYFKYFLFSNMHELVFKSMKINPDNFKVNDEVVVLNSIDSHLNFEKNTYGHVGIISSINHRYADSVSKSRGVIPHREFYVNITCEDGKMVNQRFYGYDIFPYTAGPDGTMEDLF